MKLTAEQFERAAGISDGSAALWIRPINLAIEEAGCVTPEQTAMFLAQCGHESSSFSRLEENLNYTPEGLVRTWPSRYPVEIVEDEQGRQKKIPGRLAQAHGRVGGRPADRKAIANHVYGGRMGNRPGTDDGFEYIGRGVIQVTGRSNYAECGRHLGVDLLSQPEMLANDRMLAARSAVWYWDKHELAGIRDVESVTRKINGGLNGIEDRQRRYSVALSVLRPARSIRDLV